MPGVLSRNSLEHAVAGSAGTVLATLLLYPLDRVKTLLQVDAGGSSGLDIILRLWREEGARGIYRGCAPMLQTVGSSNFLYFFLFEGLKEPLAACAGHPEGEIGPYETLIASALAGSLNMVVTEPLWRACVVVQASSKAAALDVCAKGDAGKDARAAWVFGTCCRMWATEGPGALWRGLGSSLWLVTNPVIQFFAYDFLKTLRQCHDITAVEAFTMGAVAKALATVLTFPLQVAQSRLRATRHDKTDSAQLPAHLRGMVPCLRHIASEAGIFGMYVGLWPKLLQTVTQAAFMFAFYEKIHWVIRRALTRRLRRRVLANSV
mmetsp:Transcript_122074/g.352815  ORF Transcript_122074/g.352815 Transcript_122074/m.352815 type:complete len:320 (-) Transcript_122074:90-1049(-)